MKNKLEFNIEFDENFYIIIENNNDEFPEPLPEDNYILELEEIDIDGIDFKEIDVGMLKKNKIKADKNNVNKNNIDKNNNFYISIEEDINTSEDLIKNIHQSISKVIDEDNMIKELKYHIMEEEINKKININEFDLIDNYKKRK